MSFDEIVAELPKLTGPELQQIAEKAEFLPGLDEGLRQIAEGKLIPHEEVKKSLGHGLPDLLDAHSGPGFTRHL